MGAGTELISVKPLEKFGVLRKEQRPAQALVQHEKRSGIKSYFVFISIFASITAVLMSIVVWIFLQ